MNDVVDYAAMDTGDDRPDFHALAAAGVKVAFIRGSVCYYDKNHRAWQIAIDPCFARDADAARAAGLIIGAYLFPGFGPGAPTPAEQVGAFRGAIKLIPGVDLPPGFDIEFPGTGIADTRLSQQEVGHQVETFIHELVMAYAIPPFAYSSHVQLFDTNGLGGVLDRSPDLAACFAWLKTPYRLAAGHPPDTVAAQPPHINFETWDHADLWRLPAPWTSYWLTQTQGDARGMSGIKQCDLGSWHYLTPAMATDSRWRWVAQKLGWTFVLTPQAIAAAFTAWQRDNDLVADGVLGPMSFVKLAWGALGPAPGETRSADATELPTARVVTPRA